MTIDANLIVGLQVGFALGIVAAAFIAFSAWSVQRWAKRWRAMQKRGGYAGEQQQ